jgi:hypothetical protein
MALLSAATAGFGGPGLGGCVSGNIPARQQPGSDGSTLDGGGVSADGGSGATEGSTASDATNPSDAGNLMAEASPDSNGASSGSDATITAPDSSSGSAMDAAKEVSTATGDSGGLGSSCIKAVGGDYVVRTDGAVLLEATGSETQTPVLNASTAAPLLGAIAVVDAPVAGQQGHGCAVLSDGTVWCWRSNANGNTFGQLGNGTLDTSGGNAIFRATQVLTAANTPLTNVTGFATSRGPATCAVTSDAKLYCWGALDWVVNDGASLASPYAQVITTDGATPLAGVIQASIGAVVSCAIVKGASANEVWCWGYNATYSLGLGDTMNRRYPTKVPGLTNPSQVAVSNDNYLNHGDVTCVVDSPNVRCWGYNGDGGVGIGATTPGYVMSPMVAKLQDGTTPFGGVVDLIPNNYGGFCALRTGNSVWCWGNGYPTYPSNYGVTNIVLTAGADNDSGAYNPRFLTSDGVYHMGTKSRTPNCGALQ